MKSEEGKAKGGRTPDAEAAGVAIPRERAQFRALLLGNPNYFGNLPKSPFKPIKVLHSNTSFEELACVGLNPAHDRLEAVINVKLATGYGGNICSPGSREYVRFYVDLHDNGVWHDVGVASVAVHDIPGDKPLCYAVKLDFEPFRKFCSAENIVKVRAILSWDVAPPANDPGFIPVYGNQRTVQVVIRPRLFLPLGDLVKELTLAKVKLPDPIGPIVQHLDPQVPLKAAAPQVLSVPEKRALYRGQEVPAHRFAFAEAQHLLQAPAAAEVFAGGGKTPLLDLGLDAKEIADLFNKLQIATDGDTSFEELSCVGLLPSQDMLEAVLTLKKKSGYSGGTCTRGSVEYVAFWIDFADGGGFTYMGTTSVRVHDLATIPAEGVKYAVFLKTDLSQRIASCLAGPRLVRVRAILSWQTAPPPGNPGYVPTWGNREECRVVLRTGVLAGHIPVIETVGNLGVDDIDPVTGLGSGPGVGASFNVDQSPFGGAIKISGRIGDPPDSFGGGAARFKYKVEVSPAGADDWHPLTNQVPVKISEAAFGVPIDCDPGGGFDVVCDRTLTASDDGDGLGDGWYEYLEDVKGGLTRNLVQDQLAVWATTSSMEGLWKIRITAKDPSTSPPTVFPGFQEVKVRVDNTAPTADLAITSVTFNGETLPASDCGKFKVGAVIEGSYEVHDAGTSSTNQHFGGFSLDVIPDEPANGAVVDPGARSFPVVPTIGESGTWTLDTKDMAACGYVVRLWACDRTNYDSTGNHLCTPRDVGFCLEGEEEE